MGKRNCFALVTFACSGGAASVRPFSAFDGDDPDRTYCFPFEKARIRAAFRESRSVFQLHRMLCYFTFLRPHSGFSSHFCNTHFRDTWFSSPPLFSNYSTGFRICESSKYHSKRFFYSGFTFFYQNPETNHFFAQPSHPDYTTICPSADGRGQVICAENPPFGLFGLPTPTFRKQKKSYARRTRRMSGI